MKPATRATVAMAKPVKISVATVTAELGFAVLS